MRKRLAVIMLAVLAACGGDSGTQPSPTGTLIFRLDAQTCTGTGTLNFFLDGTNIGTATISAGQSQSFANQPAGQHIAGASEARIGGYVWPSATVMIPVNGTYTQVLSCA
jgi:hypothetical protein